MANSFSKEERVAFEDLLEGFSDAMVLSRNVGRYGTDGELMERANDTIWRPMPYIVNTQDRVVGTSVTYQDVAQLAVPSTLGYEKSAPWILNAKEMRDASQENRLRTAAMQRLASDVEASVRDVISTQGTLVVAIAGAAGTYDDVALAESTMAEQGLLDVDRCFAINARDYNGLAGNLAARQDLGASKALTAYERARVGMVAGFDTYKMDAGKRVAANSATVTVDTTGNQVQYVPRSITNSPTTGERLNVDNRYQTITVSTTTGVTAGDAFTVDGLESVHHINKEATGQPKTFRVISVDSGTTMTISPPMIGANQGSPTDEELAYKNIEVVSTSATASLTFLNTTATTANPFWRMDSIEILPGRYQVPTDQGPAVLRATTDQGLEIVMTKFFDGDTFETKYTVNCFWGVVNCNPEMNGVILFNQ